jgi:hypothetical protein
MRWEGSLLLDREQRVAFGGDQNSVAWFVVVDGVPAAQWRTGELRTGGGRFGEPLSLGAGWHSIVFYAAQRHGEPVPQCVWRRDGASPEGEPVSPAYPGIVAVGWAAQLRGQPVRAGGMVSDLERYRFVDVRTDLMRLKCTPVGTAAAEGGHAFRIDGQPGDVESGVLLSTRVALPEIEARGPGDLGQLVSPQYDWFPAPILLEGGLRLGKLPPLAAHGDGLDVVCHVVWPEALPEDVRQRASLVCVQVDADGNVVHETPLVQSARTAPATATVEIRPRTERISCRAHFGGRPLFRDADAVVVRPSDAAVADITVQGRVAFCGGDRAVLLCDPLPDTPWTAAPAISARKGSAPRIVILDDFAAVGSGPDADVLPEAVATEELGGRPRVLRLSVSPDDASGTAVEFLTLASLPALLALRPDAVVLLVGAGPLEAGLPAAQSCLQALFVAQCCQARGIMPVFATLPSLPGVSGAESRSAALFIKEMSLNLGAGIVDLYAFERRGVRDVRRFADLFAAGDGSVGLSTPNNRGRRWVGVLLGEALATMIQDTPDSPGGDASED